MNSFFVRISILTLSLQIWNHYSYFTFFQNCFTSLSKVLCVSSSGSPTFLFKLIPRYLLLLWFNLLPVRVSKWLLLLYKKAVVFYLFIFLTAYLTEPLHRSYRFLNWCFGFSTCLITSSGKWFYLLLFIMDSFIPSSLLPPSLSF